MLDQANHLRQLMRGARSSAVGGGTKRPRLIVVAGSKGGVGTTTVAVNVAVALARRERRTLIVDGDLGKSDAATLCGARQGYSIGDVLAGRHGIREAIQRGPAGTYVLPGAWATGHVTDCDATAHDRLIAGLAQLEPFEHVVIDAGCGVTRIVERFWRAADRVLLVATTDSTSVLDAYAALKTTAVERRGPPVHVVMNMADDRQAEAALSRLREACRRFLGLEIDCTASLAHCREISDAAGRHTPVLLSSPDCQATRVIERLAETLDESAVVRDEMGGNRSGALSIQTEYRRPGDQ
ncbi:MAG TPA: AAA family ATPase, partial [Pirellulales bacterium]|nr:AAA family ATPase [Pirellulales bacterium]